MLDLQCKFLFGHIRKEYWPIVLTFERHFRHHRNGDWCRITIKEKTLICCSFFCYIFLFYYIMKKLWPNFWVLILEVKVGAKQNSGITRVAKHCHGNVFVPLVKSKPVYVSWGRTNFMKLLYLTASCFVILHGVIDRNRFGSLVDLKFPTIRLQLLHCCSTEVLSLGKKEKRI